MVTSSPGIDLTTGILGGAAVPVIVFALAKMRRRGEHIKDEADAADVLSQGAVRLVPYYESRIASLEKRLTAAEATAAHAQDAERRCLVRLEEMQAQINDLRKLVEHPPIVTTVTTAVTTQEPPPPPS